MYSEIGWENEYANFLDDYNKYGLKDDHCGNLISVEQYEEDL